MLADIPGIGIVTDIVGGAVGWAWDRVTGGLTAWVLGALASVAGGVAGALGATTGVDLRAVWFSGPGSPFASVRAVAAALLVAFVLLAVLGGLVRGDGPATLAHVAFAVPAAVLATGVVTAVTSHLLDLTDALSAGILGGGATTGFLSRLGAGAVATGGFAAVVVGIAAVLGGLAVWAELIVRAALVYVLVALSPLAFAVMVWPALRGVARRLAEVLMAVIVSKLVIAVTFAVGVAALAHDPQGEGVAAGLGSMLVGAAVLGLAAFAPFLVLRLLPVVEAAVLAQGIARAPLRATRAAVMTASTTQSLARLAGPGTTTVAPPAAPPDVIRGDR